MSSSWASWCGVCVGKTRSDEMKHTVSPVPHPDVRTADCVHDLIFALEYPRVLYFSLCDCVHKCVRRSWIRKCAAPRVCISLGDQRFDGKFPSEDKGCGRIARYGLEMRIAFRNRGRRAWHSRGDFGFGVCLRLKLPIRGEASGQADFASGGEGKIPRQLFNVDGRRRI